MTTAPTWDEAELLATLTEQGFDCGGSLPAVTWFGDSAEMAAQLGELVRRRQKTATASLLWAWEAEGSGAPPVGRRETVIDWRGEVLAVIEFTEVRVIAFEDVDEAFAADEGEGDRSLSFWRRVHRAFFEKECLRLGRVMNDAAPVVCVRFVVLHAAPAAARSTGDPR